MTSVGVGLVAKVHDPFDDEFLQTSEVGEERRLATGEEKVLSGTSDVVFEPARVEVGEERLVEE